MPTFDFHCRHCGKEFSSFVSLADKDKVTCPQCEAGDVRQVFSGCNIIARRNTKSKTKGNSAGAGKNCKSCMG
ncbi:MAG: zinc ribbon domain-containing protein [Clostridia bacterium]|nr:zinc ribbon domain-containing protein [Clostridia bacterium]